MNNYLVLSKDEKGVAKIIEIEVVNIALSKFLNNIFDSIISDVVPPSFYRLIKKRDENKYTFMYYLQAIYLSDEEIKKELKILNKKHYNIEYFARIKR